MTELPEHIQAARLQGRRVSEASLGGVWFIHPPDAASDIVRAHVLALNKRGYQPKGEDMDALANAIRAEQALLREAYPLLRKAVAAISYDPTLAEMEVGWTDEVDKRADDVLARMKAALGEAP